MVNWMLRPVASVAVGVAVARGIGKQRSREPYSFADLSVVITGGSRGLGLVLARRLAREGALLTLLARSQDELDRAVVDIEARGGPASRAARGEQRLWAGHLTGEKPSRFASTPSPSQK